MENIFSDLSLDRFVVNIPTHFIKFLRLVPNCIIHVPEKKLQVVSVKITYHGMTISWQ